jgi:serine protease Do
MLKRFVSFFPVWCITCIFCAMGSQPRDIRAQSNLNVRPAPVLHDAVHAMSEASASISSLIAPEVVSITAPESKATDKRLQYWIEYYGEGDNADKYHYSMLGSGVILTGDGYIVTNNHVIKDADRDSILVSLTDGTKYFAQLIGQDPTTDLALLRIYGASFPAAYIGNSDAVKVGDFVFAVGNPLGLESTVTSGIISALARDRPVNGEEQSENVIHNYLQTDAAINPGNSGGGLFDADGKLVGINSAMFTKGGGSEGLGLAIPSNLMKAVVLDLMKDGHIHRGVLGIGTTDVDEDIAMTLHLPENKGVRIDDVDKNSAAETAGLKKDDVITEIDSVPIETSNKLQTVLAMKGPGQTISLVIWRDGVKSKHSATLQAGREIMDLKKLTYRATLGVNALTVSSADVTRLNLTASDGTLVKTVYKYSAASKAGIYEDDVITSAGSTPIHSPDDLQKILDSMKPGDLLKIKILRKNKPMEKEVMLQACGSAQ